MTQSLYEEIIEAVNVRLKTGDVPIEILIDATNEIPRHPAMAVWVANQIRQSIETKGYADELEITDLAMGDELLQRRLEDTWEKTKRRVIEKLVDEEMDWRVKNGSVVEVARDDGETGYARKEDV